MPARPSKGDVARQFGGVAAAYATSRAHAGGSDLETLVAMLDLRADMDVLDVATGPGHTAFAVAPAVRSVIATDLAEGMIAQACSLAAERGIANVGFQVADAENLPFPDAIFDVVTCRIAAHHFLEPGRAVAEMARVLRPGGQLAVEDNFVPCDPDLDVFLNTLERLRDPVHVRAMNLDEWMGMLDAAGLAVEEARFDRKTHDVEGWLARTGIDEAARERTRAHLRSASDRARNHYRIVTGEGGPESYTDDKFVVRAIRQA